ncbi:MAG: hypothetical protein AAGC77_09685 [Pseudomonadota bacterium]
MKFVVIFGAVLGALWINVSASAESTIFRSEQMMGALNQFEFKGSIQATELYTLTKEAEAGWAGGASLAFGKPRVNMTIGGERFGSSKRLWIASAECEQQLEFDGEKKATRKSRAPSCQSVSTKTNVLSDSDLEQIVTYFANHFAGDVGSKDFFASNYFTRPIRRPDSEDVFDGEPSCGSYDENNLFGVSFWLGRRKCLRTDVSIEIGSIGAASSETERYVRRIRFKLKQGAKLAISENQSLSDLMLEFTYSYIEIYDPEITNTGRKYFGYLSSVEWREIIEGSEGWALRKEYRFSIPCENSLPCIGIRASPRNEQN